MLCVRRLRSALVALALLSGLGRAQDGGEQWKLQLLGEAKVGFERERVISFEQDGRKLWRTETGSSMALNRLGTTIKISSEGWSVEDEAGQQVETEESLDFSASKTVTHILVQGDKATITTTTLGPPQVKEMDWNKEWLGPRARKRFLKEKLGGGAAGGATEITYQDFAAQVGPTAITVKALGREKVAVPGQADALLLHLQSTMSVMPGMVTDEWVDADFEAQKTVVEQMGMSFVSVPSTREECMAAVANPDGGELFGQFSPYADVRYPDPYHMDEVVLELTQQNQRSPFPPVADGRQTIVEKKSDTTQVVRLSKVVPTGSFPLPLTNLTEEEKDCLESNAMLQCDAPEVIELAKQAVGDEKDAWKAAQKIERFVYTYMTKKGMGTGFASAKEICRDRAGDCTEHGVLLAALGRAAGIPSRVAIGLLYFEGIWGGHMWAEVSLGGKWYALDGVLGHGSVDACHLGLATSTLNEIGAQAAFANVGLGMTLKFKTLSYRHGAIEVKVGADSKVFAVDGQRYRHLLYQLSLKAPEGFTIEPNEKIEFGNNEIVELDRSGASDIDVDVRDVTYDFDLDQMKTLLAARGVNRVKATEHVIDGRPGRVLRGKSAGKEGKEVLLAAVLRDQMLVTVSMRLDADGDEALFDEVVKSLDLDG